MALGVAAGGLGSVLGPPRSLIRGKGLSMLVGLARRPSGGGWPATLPFAPSGNEGSGFFGWGKTSAAPCCALFGGSFGHPLMASFGPFRVDEERFVFSFFFLPFIFVFIFFLPFIFVYSSFVS